MLRRSTFLQSLVSLWVLSLVFPLLAVAQQSAVQPRIVQPIDETQLTVLKGNTHPLARAQFDQGAAPADLPMERMLLVLKHSAAQETALNQLLDDQHDKNSPNYHKWLTPEQYGQQFGPADQDVQTVTNWLQSHGFQIGEVTSGKGMIEFSGTAGQVQEALHTSIHKYLVNGQEHSANSSDPSIPTALTPVVAGVESLNNFPRKPMNHVAGVVSRDKATGKVTPLHPLFTLPSPGGCGVQSADCYAVGPYDFATIYNVLPLWNATPTAIDGTGETIAIVGETNINTQDVEDFRTFFGLPVRGISLDANVILNGPDPGILTDGEETEADLDVEWSGAVAKGATIDFVVSETTESTSGVDLSALYIIENNLAPVLSESYGFCELGLGTAGNTFYSEMWQQASAQGITVLLATGDSGAAGCDSDSATPPAPSQFGLAVSGYASTPYNVAVGGTDFNDLTNASTYWNSTNTMLTQASAKSYIPETTWNNSCTNAVFGDLLGYSTDAETNCNNSKLADFVVTVGGGGGASSCIVSDGQDPSSCTAFYAKPSWQTGTGVPADGKRDLPDVSLFAASGSPSGSFYIVCQADQIVGATSCDSADPNTEFLGVGGTSASTPSFAGVMALVNQKTTSAQGNANYVLYKMAAQQPTALNDVNPTTPGTIAMPCATGSPNCTTSTTGDAYGVLSGYSTTKGYDQATGLGSVNVENLVNDWTSVTFTGTTTTLTSVTSTTITHGQPVTFSIKVAPNSGTANPAGAVALIGSPTNPNYGIDNFALVSGADANATTTLLPGGSYNVRAQYAGDGTFGGSFSSLPGVPVTVAPESSKTVVELETFNSSGAIVNSNATTAVYGSPYVLRVNVTNAAGACDTDAGTNNSACPAGSVAVTDASVPLETLQLNSLGYAEDQFIQLATGSHSLAGAFTPSDLSFSASASATDSVSITQATTGITASAATTVLLNTSITLTATVSTQSTGAAPTGTVTFLANGTALSGTVTYTPTAGSASGSAGLVASLSASFSAAGSESITAKYNGDGNYAASPTSAAVVVNVQPFNLTASATTVSIASPGGSANVTLTIAGGTGYNGTVTFSNASCSGLPSKTTCSFSPTSVTGSGTTTLTIKTTASTAALDKRHGFGWWMGSSSAAFAGIFLMGAVPKRRRTSLLALLVVFLAILLGCGGGSNSSGGGSPGTPVGSYTVTVTAASGVTPVIITLNVQ